jgi:integrase
MASLRRFPRSPYWYACFAGPDGRVRQVSTKETERRRAQKIADRYETASNVGRTGFLVERQARKIVSEIYEISNREVLASDSVAQFFTRWLESVKVESSPKTYQRYSGIVAKFIRWLGPRAEIGLTHLTSHDIVKFRDYLSGKHSPASVNLSLGCIQAGLSRAFKDRLVDINEASRVPRLKEPVKQVRRAFTDEELRAVLAVADTEWRGMILAGLYTGMRLGDACALSWDNIDLQSREIQLQTEKTGRKMVIPIAEPFYRHLIKIAGDDTGPLFPRAWASRQRAIPTGTLSNQFRALLERAGIVERVPHRKLKHGRDAKRDVGGLGFHCLRHTATTLLKRAGASDVVAREIIGHETAAVSRAYSHIDIGTLRTAIDRLPDLTD